MCIAHDSTCEEVREDCRDKHQPAREDPPMVGGVARQGHECIRAINVSDDDGDAMSTSSRSASETRSGPYWTKDPRWHTRQEDPSRGPIGKVSYITATGPEFNAISLGILRFVESDALGRTIEEPGPIEEPRPTTAQQRVLTTDDEEEDLPDADCIAEEN